jgi:putative membrane protein
MKKLLYLITGVTFLFFAQACQENKAKNYNKVWVDADGLNFIRSSDEGYLTVTKASALAKTHSKNKRVLNFAKMIIDNHYKALSGLKKIGSLKIVDVKDSISVAHQQQIEGLAKQTGVAFDRSYLEMIIKGNEEALITFTTASQNADPDISKFATKAIPAIKTHRDAANAVLSSLK